MPDLFIQTAPSLGNQYDEDAFLRGYLRRKLPSEMLIEVEQDLHDLGALAGGELYRMQLEDRLNEPRLTQWDGWGNRIDHIELTPLWKRAAEIAAQSGLIAIPYEAQYGQWSRVHQFAKAFLFHP
jgi:acyl-CoA dehydrogenase